MPWDFSLNSPFFNWVILPILIFVARVMDVTIGTIRIMLVARGRKYLAPALGFIEMMIWLLAVRQIFQNIANVACYFAFATGFSTGNFVGMWIEERMAMGVVVVRIITKKDAGELIEYLKSKGYGVTSVDAQGSTGKVDIIFTIVKRSDLAHVIEIIKQFNPKAFYSVEDVKFVSEGVFPQKKNFMDALLSLKK